MPARKKKPARSTPVTTLRLAARIVPVVLVLTVLMLCTAGDFYVHHPADWLADHRSVLTAPLEYFGDRTAFLTDALGWTGHDCVYESDDPVPENQVLFAGEPVRLGAPAPADIITLDRDEYLIGWSPSLQIPVWAAYHVPAAARFPYERSKANFVKDRNVESSPAPTAYTNTGYDRSHMVPFNAIVTRIFVLLLRRYMNSCELPSDMPGDTALAMTIARYLQANAASVTLERLADYFHYTPEYTSRLVKRVTGQSFMQLLTSFRIENAKQLLRDTSITVADIGASVGYESGEHFIRTFRKQTGYTPSEYRHRR